MPVASRHDGGRIAPMLDESIIAAVLVVPISLVGMILIIWIIQR